METIAFRLKKAREWKGWKQSQLAIAADVSTGTIGNIEAGIRQAKGSIPQIADALGVSYQWLANGKGDMLPATATAALTLPSLTASATAANHQLAPVQQAQDATANIAPELTEQCRAIVAMLATLPDDPVVRFQVLGQLAEIVAKARGSPPSHQDQPAYSYTASRTG